MSGRRPPRVNPGRVAAARVLLGVEGGAPADDLLEQLAPQGRDRTLTWHLALGVLRRQGSLDHVLRPFSRRSIESLDAPVRAVLRLGAFELLYGRTLAHAAVHQAVDLARALRLPLTRLDTADPVEDVLPPLLREPAWAA